MTSSTPNLLILMSDEHSRKALGCYGNPLLKTPNLDRLAARGTLFSNGYTNCPICVPARAAFATGQYGHTSGHWDNATPYIGEPHSWGHALQQAGVTVGSIGKLHYRNAEDDTGFDFQQLPMHLVGGIGDVLGCVREPLPVRWKTRTMAEKIGPGETSYTAYDRSIAEAATNWIADRSSDEDEKPWALFVSMVAPHFPLIAPEEFYELYEAAGTMPSKLADDPDHPWLVAFRECYPYDNFTDETTRIALASYFGLVSFLDNNVGKILNSLDAAGLTDNTRILYVSDHGDNMGERGLWGKSTLYEESAGIPMIAAGPGIPAGRVSTTPVSLIDVYPTVIDAMGLQPDGEIRPGRSLMEIANSDDDPERVAYSEYHAAGAYGGAFMIRRGRWKFCYYINMPPQLFDLEADPQELHDLGKSADHADVRASLEADLRAICDPEDVDRRAHRDQAAIIDANGGRQKVVDRGGFGATPPPGEAPQFTAAR